MKRITPEHFIAHSSWRFADTMACTPHEYTVREMGDRRGTALSAEAFDWFARHVFENGQLGRYRDFPEQTYLTIGPYYYWTMGEPGVETTVINRALVTDREKSREQTRATANWRATQFFKSVELDEAYGG